MSSKDDQRCPECGIVMRQEGDWYICHLHGHYKFDWVEQIIKPQCR